MTSRAEPRFDHVRAQAIRYLTTVHGENWMYHAPEMFENLLERWIVAIANGHLDVADECLDRIEQLTEEYRGVNHEHSS